MLIITIISHLKWFQTLFWSGFVWFGIILRDPYPIIGLIRKLSSKLRSICIFQACYLCKDWKQLFCYNYIFDGFYDQIGFDTKLKKKIPRKNFLFRQNWVSEPVVILVSFIKAKRRGRGEGGGVQTLIKYTNSTKFEWPRKIPVSEEWEHGLCRLEVFVPLLATKVSFVF